ncbi:MAG: right-handed parallel beta-helix repeat-containing protein [Pedobacter sp.]|uniref:right-handed parallel beta-helix repeat-containing protein n=1 Tax=Pedobacter sp. TaxID=1411316 RepID=UPI0035693C6D
MLILIYLTNKMHCLSIALSFIFLTGCTRQNLLDSATAERTDPVTEVNVLDFRTVSSTDHEMIQKAIDYASLNKITSVYIPAGNYNIDAAGVGTAGARGILLRDSMTLRMDNNTILKAIPNNVGNYSIVRIHNAEDVKIIGGKILGERYEHIGTAGEWGMGIDIRDSKRVGISNVSIKYCWGDAMYISVNSKDLLIDNITCDSNRRQGLSVIDCDGIIVKNSSFNNTYGTNPQSGLDLEPNAGDEVKNVLIQNCVFNNNFLYGFTTYAPNGPISDVVVENCTFTGGKVGVAIRYSKKIKLLNSTISGCTEQGIRVNLNCEDVEIADVSINGSVANAMTLANSKNTVLKKIDINNYTEGISISVCDSMIISGLNLSTSSSASNNILVNNSSKLHLDSVSVNGGSKGISVTNSSYGTLANSTIKSAGTSPLVFSGSSNFTIQHNTLLGNCHLEDNKYVNILIDNGSNKNTIKLNKILTGTSSNQSKYGIRLTAGTFNNVVSDNTIEAGSYRTLNILDEGTNSVY